MKGGSRGNRDVPQLGEPPGVAGTSMKGGSRGNRDSPLDHVGLGLDDDLNEGRLPREPRLRPVGDAFDADQTSMKGGSRGNRDRAPAVFSGHVEQLTSMKGGSRGNRD